jgi:hypothetical protein
VVTEVLVDFLEAAGVDVVDHQLVAAAAQVLQGFGAALLRQSNNLPQLLLGYLFQPLVEPVFLSLRDLLRFLLRRRLLQRRVAGLLQLVALGSLLAGWRSDAVWRVFCMRVCVLDGTTIWMVGR